MSSTPVLRRVGSQRLEGVQHYSSPTFAEEESTLNAEQYQMSQRRSRRSFSNRRPLMNMTQTYRQADEMRQAPPQYVVVWH